MRPKQDKPRPWRKLYSTARWKRLRASQLQSEPLCKYCLEDGLVAAAEVVDHIEPHKGKESLFFNSGNLQSLCKRHHDSAKQRFEKSGIMTGCNESGVPIDPNHHWNN